MQVPLPMHIHVYMPITHNVNIVYMYLCPHVSVWAVSDSSRLLCQLFWVHGLERSDGEGVEKLHMYK